MKRAYAPFTALLSHTSFQLFGDQTPLSGAVVAHKFDHFPVFLVRPRTFGDRRVEKSVPTMLTLSVRATIAHVLRNVRPIDHVSVRTHAVFQPLILRNESHVDPKMRRFIELTSSFNHFLYDFLLDDEPFFFTRTFSSKSESSSVKLLRLQLALHCANMRSIDWRKCKSYRLDNIVTGRASSRQQQCLTSMSEYVRTATMIQ